MYIYKYLKTAQLPRAQSRHPSGRSGSPVCWPPAPRRTTKRSATAWATAMRGRR